jgi:hypothetical protein
MAAVPPSAFGARVPGLRAVFEGASGREVDADVIYLGGRGLFVCTDRPLPDGKLFPLTLRPREGAQRSVVASVLVSRARGTADEPAGMIVTLVDVDDAMVGLLERLAKSSERTDPGTGGPPRGPSREPTVLGVGGLPEKVGTVAPVVVLAPSRERTVLGVAPTTAAAAAASKPAVKQQPVPAGRERSQQEPPPEDWEPSVPIPLVARAPAPPPQAPAQPEQRTPQQPPKQTPEPAREPSVAVDLSELDSRAKEASRAAAGNSGVKELVLPRSLPSSIPPSSPPSSAPSGKSGANEPSLIPAGVPRHRGRKALLLLLVCVAIGVGYFQREHLRPLWQKIQPLFATASRSVQGNSSPPPAASVPAPPPVSATAADSERSLDRGAPERSGARSPAPKEKDAVHSP